MVEVEPTYNKWSRYMNQLYASRKGPVLGTVSNDEVEAKAREILSSKGHLDAFKYAFGSAGSSQTHSANRKIFDQWKIVPRMLVDATKKDSQITLFGVQYSSPLIIAPVGVQGIFHEDAELATARAAKDLGVPMILSTAATRSIEEVAKENGDAPRWFQLYWPVSDEITLSLLNRAKTNGYTALVVTLDTFALGWRPLDIATSYLPFLHGVGIQVGLSDPVFMKREGRELDLSHPAFPYESAGTDTLLASGDEEAIWKSKMGMKWLAECNSGRFRTWEDLKFLRDNWSGPLIIKGIQSVHDAEKALEFNVDGIIVSNHGGRQVDGAIASLHALDIICQSSKILEAQKTGALTMLFDSGIRTGSDIIKALALGAQAVLLGRPYIYGLVVAGEAGVKQVVAHTLAEFEVNLGLAGYRSVQEIQGKREEVLVKHVG